MTFHSWSSYFHLLRFREQTTTPNWRFPGDGIQAFMCTRKHSTELHPQAQWSNFTVYLNHMEDFLNITFLNKTRKWPSSTTRHAQSGALPTTGQHSTTDRYIHSHSWSIHSCDVSRRCWHCQSKNTYFENCTRIESYLVKIVGWQDRILLIVFILELKP